MRDDNDREYFKTRVNKCIQGDDCENFMLKAEQIFAKVTFCTLNLLEILNKSKKKNK